MLLDSNATELQNPYAKSGASSGSGGLDESLDTHNNLLESTDSAVLNSPLHNYETFERYIAHLNK